MKSTKDVNKLAEDADNDIVDDMDNSFDSGHDIEIDLPEQVRISNHHHFLYIVLILC